MRSLILLYHTDLLSGVAVLMLLSFIFIEYIDSKKVANNLQALNLYLLMNSRTLKGVTKTNQV